MENTDKELSKILQALAANFHTTADKLFQILIRESYIKGIGLLIAYMIYSALFFRIVWWYKKTSFEEKNGVIFMTSIIMALATFGIIMNVPTMLFNPEYYALTKIFNK